MKAYECPVCNEYRVRIVGGSDVESFDLMVEHIRGHESEALVNYALEGMKKVAMKEGEEQ